MRASRKELTGQLESLYRSSGMKVTEADGALNAAGPGGVTWIGRAVVPEDFESAELEAEIVDLADRRMPKGGELCPLDLLPHEECEGDLRALLNRTGLARRPHVSVYTRAA